MDSKQKEQIVYKRELMNLLVTIFFPLEIVVDVDVDVMFAPPNPPENTSEELHCSDVIIATVVEDLKYNHFIK